MEQNRELEHQNEELLKAVLVFQESKEEEPPSVPPTLDSYHLIYYSPT